MHDLYALISVSDKTGVVDFAKELKAAGYNILSTGGSARILKENGLNVKDVSDYTGFPEMMNGRVKTLHPKVHGGILGVRDNENHVKEAKAQNIEFIDLICVNLYPFEKTVSDENVTLENAVENIDIGGPTLIRSAAKNFKFVTIVTDPKDYPDVINEMKKSGEISYDFRKKCAVKAFEMTGKYDNAINTWLSNRLNGEKKKYLAFSNGLDLRYGENPHQKSTIFFPDQKTLKSPVNVAETELLHGKPMSYNNYIDADASFKAAADLYPQIAVSVIKHSNPCGLATGKTLEEAFEKAWEGDIVSAFGSVITVTAPIDLKSAKFLQKKFIEVIIAPDYEQDALEFLKSKSKNLRILKCGDLKNHINQHPEKVYRFIDGALLEQDPDITLFKELKCVTKVSISQEDKKAFEFAYKSVKHIKSNAINIIYEYSPGFYMTLGMGAGQPNRVDALRKLASSKAKENISRLFGKENINEIMEKAVLASDAFFPFADTIHEAAEIGIKKIIQPGGSVRDEEVIEACNKEGIAMIFTGIRHFNH